MYFEYELNSNSNSNINTNEREEMSKPQVGTFQVQYTIEEKTNINIINWNQYGLSLMKTTFYNWNWIWKQKFQNRNETKIQS